MVRATRTEALELLETYNRTRDVRARDQLVANYVPLVRSLCSRFRRSAEPQEDLFQMGMLGLLNAVQKFDPSYGTSFSSLAIPEVRGAILNYLRDHGSLIKIPRALQQNKQAVDKMSESMAPRLGRWPSVPELAEACELSEREIGAAIQLGRNGAPCSLDQDLENDEADSSGTLSDFVGGEDKGFDMSVVRMTLQAALNSLPDREKTIVILRFYRGLSQRQTAERIGVSQMHVSRLERSALVKLRLFMQRDSTPSAPADHVTETAQPQASAA